MVHFNYKQSELVIEINKASKKKEVTLRTWQTLLWRCAALWPYNRNGGLSKLWLAYSIAGYLTSVSLTYITYNILSYSGTESIVASADTVGLLVASGMGLLAAPGLRPLYISLEPPLKPYPYTFFLTLCFTLFLEFHELVTTNLPTFFLLLINVMSVLIVNNLVRNIRDQFIDLNRKLKFILRQYHNSRLFISSELHFHTRSLDPLVVHHWRLCKLVSKVSSVLGWQLISLLFYLIAQLTTSLYYIYVYIRYHRIAKVSRQVGYFILFSLLLHFIVVPVTQTSDQAVNTSKIIVNFLYKTEQLPVFQRKLKIYLKQLQYQEAKFKALGLVEFDNSVIASTYGAVSMYWAILTQFQDSDNPCSDTGSDTNLATLLNTTYSSL